MLWPETWGHYPTFRLETLKTLAARKIPGRILTTDYLTFTQPEALRRLAEFPNLDVRLYRTASGRGFHAKGWIFERGDEERRLVVGSSNWTQYALMQNEEWNVHLVTKKDGAFVQAMAAEFEALWTSERTLSLAEALAAYEAEWNALKAVRREQRRMAQQMNGAETDEPAVLPIMPLVPMTPVTTVEDENGDEEAEVRTPVQLSLFDESSNQAVPTAPSRRQEPQKPQAREVRPLPPMLPARALEPNAMQRQFVEELARLREAGEKKALLISATGTGKTYAAAFGAKTLQPRRMLFLVHRGQIAKQARRSFDKIFGNADSGLLMGDAAADRNRHAARVFATVQTMSKDAELARWSPDAFDLIIIDEVHRAAAPSYAKIFDHFEPDFWLGMSASPERGDGADVFELFDHNIACEVRLQDALEHDLLCPFHYFGIADVTFEDDVRPGEVDLQDPKRRERTFADFAASSNRVDHILKAARFYGHGGERVKGLAFVSRNEEAVLLAAAFTARGIPSLAISGADSQAARERAIGRLTSDSIPESERLSYIFSVDILNEGVDIPEVNQLLLLRPTESPVVFVQQLGRGLRRSPEKDYLTVIDFIANYDSNFMIPVALSGDRSYDKDAMRREVMTLNKRIPGCVSVNFDELARERVLAAVDRAKTLDMKLLRSAWENLRARLGRVPELCDFLTNESIDPVKFMEKSASYEAFMTRSLRSPHAPDLRINEAGYELLAYLSKRFGKGKRLPDTLLLAKLFKADGAEVVDLRDVRSDVEKIVGDMLSWTPRLLTSLGRCVTGRFWTDEWVLAESVTADGKALSLNAPANVPMNAKTTGGKPAPFDFASHPHLRLAPAVRALLNDPENTDLPGAVDGLIRFMRAAWDERWSAGAAAGSAGAAAHRAKRGVVDAETGLVVGAKYTYEDACRFLGWATNVNAQVIGGYKFDAETRTFPVFVNYKKDDGAIRYHDHFVAADHLVALSKTNRKPDSVDADHIFREPDNALHLFVRKDKNDAEAKAFYYLGRMTAEGEPVPVVVNDAPAFEINYRLRTPVRADLYEYLTEERVS